MTREVGALPYIAPEVRKEADYGHPIDIWGLGATGYPRPSQRGQSLEDPAARVLHRDLTRSPIYM